MARHRSLFPRPNMGTCSRDSVMRGRSSPAEPGLTGSPQRRSSPSSKTTIRSPTPARGRAEFVAQFPSLAAEPMQARLAIPHDRETFERCKLDWDERETNAPIYRLHHDLLELRRTDAAFRRQAPGTLDGAVIGPLAFVLRFAGEQDKDERLLVVNLGTDLVAPSFAEPLVAPPDGH